MLRKGCTEVPKVSEIVHEAGITNQAFYRHFRSRDDVIVATYEQGMLSVYSYLRHRWVRSLRGGTNSKRGSTGYSRRSRIRSWLI